MKIPTKKELQAQRSKAKRTTAALIVAIGTLHGIAAALPSVVHPTYSKSANKALGKISKLIRSRK